MNKELLIKEGKELKEAAENSAKIKKIMDKAPASLHTLVASGDVLVRCKEPLQEIPEADVVCYGLWADPSLASRHGVFVTDRNTPDRLAFMLQKPSTEELGRLSESHFFMMDAGIWLLSDKAVEILWNHSLAGNGTSAADYDSQASGNCRFREYDLYSEFGPALGDRPAIRDAGINSLSVAILPLPGGEFYHYGTSRELISSTLSVQNLVNDQRHIMQRSIKPHPAMFVQNAVVNIRLKPENAMLWIENSFIGERWQLSGKHVITGVPENDWALSLPEGICVDVVPYGEKYLAARPYGFDDPFRGASDSPDTLFLGRPAAEWASARGISLPEFADMPEETIKPAPVAKRRAIVRMGIICSAAFWFAVFVALCQAGMELAIMGRNVEAACSGAASLCRREETVGRQR